MQTKPFLLLFVVSFACACTPGDIHNDTCPPGSINCDDGCCEVCTEHSHCPQGQSCCNGSCSADCQACEGVGTLCGTSCRDLDNDFAACGDCDVSCAAVFGDAADACQNGQCVCGAMGQACTGGRSCCGGQCVDLDSSAANCGQCGESCSQLCVGSECIEPTADICGDLTRCNEGFGYVCADLDSRETHCGACGFDCQTELGSRVDSCMLGHCVCAAQGSACDPDETCTSSGCEVATEPACGTNTCSGCCSSATCVAGDQPTECGGGGASCVDCTTAYGNRANGCANDQCVCLATNTLCPSGKECTTSGCACPSPNSSCGSTCCSSEQTCVENSRCESVTLGSPTISPSTLTLPDTGCTPAVIRISFPGNVPDSRVDLVEIGQQPLSAPIPVFGNWSSDSFSFPFDLCWNTTEACIKDGSCTFDQDLAVSYVYTVTPLAQPTAATTVTMKIVPGPLTFTVDQVTWSLPDAPGTKTHVFTVGGAPADRDIGIVQISHPGGTTEPPLRFDNQTCNTCSGHWNDNVFTFSNDWNACVQTGLFRHRVADIYGRTAENHLEVVPGTPSLHVTPTSWTIPLSESSVRIEYRLGGAHRAADSTVATISGPDGSSGNPIDLKSLGAYWDPSRCNVLVLDWHKKPYARSGTYEYELYDTNGQRVTTSIRLHHNTGARMRIKVNNGSFLDTATVRKPSGTCAEELTCCDHVQGGICCNYTDYVFSYAGERVNQDAGVINTSVPLPDTTDTTDTNSDLRDVDTESIGRSPWYWNNDSPNDFHFPWMICANTLVGNYTYQMTDDAGHSDPATLRVVE